VNEKEGVTQKEMWSTGRRKSNTNGKNKLTKACFA